MQRVEQLSADSDLGGICSLEITFMPTALGVRTGTLALLEAVGRQRTGPPRVWLARRLLVAPATHLRRTRDRSTLVRWNRIKYMNFRRESARGFATKHELLISSPNRCRFYAVHNWHEKSKRINSGFNSIAFWIASAPSAASPTTFQSGSVLFIAS